MPRKPRFFLPDLPVHVVQRGNNRQAVFFDNRDRRSYLDWLAQAVGEQGCSIHAYVLMTNHVHLLLTPANAPGGQRDAAGPWQTLRTLLQPPPRAHGYAVGGSVQGECGSGGRLPARLLPVYRTQSSVAHPTGPDISLSPYRTGRGLRQ